MTDQREKRIQEIRENKFDDDTEFLLEEIDRLERVLRATEIGRSNETLLKNEVIRQYEELELEVSRLQVERETFKEALQAVCEHDKKKMDSDKSMIESLTKEAKKYLVERDKALEERDLLAASLDPDLLGVPHDPLD